MHTCILTSIMLLLLMKINSVLYSFLKYLWILTSSLSLLTSLSSDKPPSLLYFTIHIILMMLFYFLALCHFSCSLS